MLRGTQKKMIIMKPPLGSPFESACFVLRREASLSSADTDAMLKEAHRIIEDSEIFRKKKARTCRNAHPLRNAFLLFGLGSLCGAALFAMLLLLF